MDTKKPSLETLESITSPKENQSLEKKPRGKINFALQKVISQINQESGEPKLRGGAVLADT
jgi:hypothetical protein